MKMSDIRKQAQGKLRKKFKWSTGKFQGNTFITTEVESKTRNGIEVYNIALEFGPCFDPKTRGKEIHIYRTKRKFSKNKRRYEFPLMEEYVASLSLDELDLIHTIAHQISEEYKTG